MENISGQELSAQEIDDRHQIILRTPDNPIGHRCPGEQDSHSLPVFFLAVERDALYIFLIHHIGNRTWRCQGMI